MKRILTYCIVTVILLLTNENCRGAAADSPVTLYSRWQGLPADKLMKMGEGFDVRNSSDSALVCYSVVVDRLRGSARSEEDKETLSRALTNMGYIYATFMFDYTRSLELFEESLKISRENDFRENLAFVYLNIGGVYLGCNMMYGKNIFSKECWDYLDKALAAGIATGKYEVSMVAFLNMGQLFFDNPEKGRIPKAVTSLEAAKIPADVPFRDFARKYADGLLAYIKGDYDRAATLFSEAGKLTHPGSMHSARLELIALSAQAESLEAAGKLAEAVGIEEQLLEKARATGSSDEETRACRKLAELYEKHGDSERSRQFRFLYFQKKDSTLTARDITVLSKMPFVNELEQIRGQVEHERTQKRRLMVSVGIAALFIILFLLYIVTLTRSRRKMKAYIKELYRKNMELVRLERRELRVREEEGDASSATPLQLVQSQKYASSSLDDKESRRIAALILEAMADTELITDSRFTMEVLSEKIGCPYRYVSQVVNEAFGKNFRSLLNEYRVKEACLRLADTEKYGSYTIEAVAESVGFNSRSNFSVTFKKITGLTPAQFQKNALNEEE